MPPKRRTTPQPPAELATVLPPRPPGPTIGAYWYVGEVERTYLWPDRPADFVQPGDAVWLPYDPGDGHWQPIPDNDTTPSAEPGDQPTGEE